MIIYIYIYACTYTCDFTCVASCNAALWAVAHHAFHHTRRALDARQVRKRINTQIYIYTYMYKRTRQVHGMRHVRDKCGQHMRTRAQQNSLRQKERHSFRVHQSLFLTEECCAPVMGLLSYWYISFAGLFSKVVNTCDSVERLVLCASVSLFDRELCCTPVMHL